MVDSLRIDWRRGAASSTGSRQSGSTPPGTVGGGSEVLLSKDVVYFPQQRSSIQALRETRALRVEVLIAQ